MSEITWDIRRHGYAWKGEHAFERYYKAPEKMELWEGKIFCNEESRLRMIGLLLENVGVDAVVRLGDPEVWREAVADL